MSGSMSESSLVKVAGGEWLVRKVDVSNGSFLQRLLVSGEKTLRFSSRIQAEGMSSSRLGLLTELRPRKFQPGFPGEWHEIILAMHPNLQPMMMASLSTLCSAGGTETWVSFCLLLLRERRSRCNIGTFKSQQMGFKGLASHRKAKTNFHFSW